MLCTASVFGVVKKEKKIKTRWGHKTQYRRGGGGCGGAGGGLVGVVGGEEWWGVWVVAGVASKLTAL